MAAVYSEGLDPQERYERIRDGIGALAALRDDDAHDVTDPLFWTEHGRGERALEGLRQVARYYSDEHAADLTFCVYCSEPVDDPEDAKEEAHRGCARTEGAPGAEGRECL